MSNIKTTDWFDGAKFVPYHVGEYETDDWSVFWKCYPKRHWDGKLWYQGYYMEISKDYARRQVALNQNQTWRGIKK